MTLIPVSCFDKTGDMAFFRGGYDQKEDPLICDESLCRNMIHDINAKADGRPILEFEDEFLYGLCKDSAGSIVIIGPVSFHAADGAEIGYYKSIRNISAGNSGLTHVSVSALAAALVTIHFASAGEYIDESELSVHRMNNSSDTVLTENDIQSYILDTAEHEIEFHQFSLETLFFQKIKDGDTEGVRRSLYTSAGLDDHRLGKMAGKSIKQYEYLAITGITLAARTAITGGLDPQTAYTMSNLFLQRLERCTEKYEIVELSENAFIAFAERVRQKKQDRSPLSYIEWCKTYITEHLNQLLRVDKIAAKAGINKSYLSSRFSQTEGVSIGQFIQKKRIEAAANMLKYSDTSITEISNYLWFSSQSHLGRLFKKYMGQTPKQYRERNRVTEFMAKT